MRAHVIDPGDTAWLLAAAALVLLMVPGLALFYGGMVRSKSVLNMMMMTFSALGVITLVWVLVGYSLAFGDDIGGGLLAISQFTLFGDVRRGLRPSFDGAMEPVAAEKLYDRFVAEARARGVHVETGRFRADMQVFVDNDGPVTILVDSKKTF